MVVNNLASQKMARNMLQFQQAETPELGSYATNPPPLKMRITPTLVGQCLGSFGFHLGGGGPFALFSSVPRMQNS